VIKIPDDAEFIAFIHSPLQGSIFSRISGRGWYSIGMRGQTGTLVTREDFCIGNVDFVLDFVEALSRSGKSVNVLVPHSQSPNILFPCLLGHRAVKGVGYIEDGWDTWRHLRESHPRQPAERESRKVFTRIFLMIVRKIIGLYALNPGRNVVRQVLSGMVRFSARFSFFGSYYIPKCFLGFFVTFRWPGTTFVDVSPRQIESWPVRDSPLLFLNPRYLREPDRFIDGVVQILRGRILTLQLHPGFWRKTMGARLQDFLRELELRGVGYTHFQSRETTEEIVFEAYAQGFREFWSADSTIQLTSHTYREHLPGLRIISISEMVDRREGYLATALGYIGGQIDY